MKKIVVAGVTHLSDLYPNVKYKHRMLMGMEELEAHSLVVDLGGGSHFASLRKGVAARLVTLLRTGLGTLYVFLRLLFIRADYVYILYPAPILGCLLSFWPFNRERRIVLDAFISLYDTAVIDRALHSEAALLSKVLFWVERRAFKHASVVVVDTTDNASYLASLFDLPADKFQAIPLSIPEVQVVDDVPPGGDGLRCLFVGSLVPLHGIEIILELARACAESLPGFSLEIVGDGQDGKKIERFLADTGVDNITWHRGFMETDALVARIQQADLCLGIFGAGDKTRRVLPYKIYYYCALGKPFLTLDTPCLRRFCGEDSDRFLCDSQAPVASLFEKTSEYLQDPARLEEAADRSQQLFHSRLAPDVVRRAFANVFQ